MVNPYKVLEVDSNESMDSIKKSYRKLAKMYHPDSPTGDSEKFIQVREAWEMVKSLEGTKTNIKKSFVTHISLFKFRRI